MHAAVPDLRYPLRYGRSDALILMRDFIYLSHTHIGLTYIYCLEWRVQYQRSKEQLEKDEQIAKTYVRNLWARQIDQVSLVFS